jgi:hypothetical protein
MLKHIFSILIGVLMAFCSLAQSDQTLYYMTRIPQSINTNPSFLPETKYNVGFPAISSIYASAGHNGFTINNLLNDSIARTIRRMSLVNDVTTNIGLELLHIGFTVDKHYFTLTTTEKINFRFSYPKDFFVFIWHGNGGDDLLDKRANMDGFAIDFNHYREYALGWAAPINEFLTVGARFKYLSGFQNISTIKSELGLTTSEPNYDLVLDGGMEIQTSGVNSIIVGDENYKKMLLNAGNNGYATDFGFNFKLSEEISFSGALLDLGYINWNNDVKNFKQDDFKLQFSGLDFNSIISQDDFTGRNTLQALQDTISNTFVLKESFDTYKTWLDTRILAGAQYSFSKAHRAGFLLQNQFLNGRSKPSATLSMNSRIGHVLSLSASVSYYNRSIANVGAGFAFNLLPIQIYLVTDNILFPFIPFAAKNVNLRAGINITITSRNKRG